MAEFKFLNLADIYGAADRDMAARTQNQLQQFALKKAMRDEQKQMALADAYKNAYTMPQTAQAAVPGQTVTSDDQLAYGGSPADSVATQMPGTPAREAVPGGLDSNKLLSALYGGGFGQEAYALQQAQAAADLKRRETEAGISEKTAKAGKENQETLVSKLTQSRNVLSTISNPQQAAQYVQSLYADPQLGPVFAKAKPLEQALQAIPQDAAGLQEWVARNSLGAKEFQDKVQAQAQLKETARGHDLTNKAAMISAGAAASNARTAADRLAMEKEAPKGQYDSARGIMVDPRTGIAMPVTQGGAPIGAAPSKPSESYLKQQTGVENVRNAIADYKNALKSFGAIDALSPDDRAKMGTFYNNMMLQAKEAYNLGVLNGPDYDILQAVVRDPNSLKGMITSKSALDNQASNLESLMLKIGQTSARVHGQPSPNLPSPNAGMESVNATPRNDLYNRADAIISGGNNGKR